MSRSVLPANRKPAPAETGCGGKVVSVIQQAVEHRGGDHLICENCAPLCHPLMSRDEGSGLLVAGHHEMELQVGGALFEGQVAQLLDDGERGLGGVSQPVGELPLGVPFCGAPLPARLRSRTTRSRPPERLQDRARW